MIPAYEYLVCQVQFGKVIYVNNEWQGTEIGRSYTAEQMERILDSCPDQIAFLKKLGREGWELVGVSTITQPEGTCEKLYFKRPL